ncbi:Hypothetical protein CINCED_3A019186 [Cinara cedri]|uniref:Sperm-tail PG-rich repeat n=1 Tax=Cinara cedri TaxID=506608 RepID=A0A5E4MKV0_9HEMI|nr:Hypothetical protein CINCED_3A019186 [Cinara cedri]
MPKKTDPTMWQSPAYSLRPQTKIRNDSSGPGPAYKIDQVTRHGRDTSGKIIFGDYNIPNSKTLGPGPAIYLPCYPNLIHAPTPKLSLPLEELKKFDIPAPNAYTLRIPDISGMSSVKSRRKGYTIQWKTRYPFGEPGRSSPGPAAYGPTNIDAYKNHAPAVSIGARTRETGQNSGPGPQAYYVSECSRGCTTKFSFGIKHSRKSTPYVIPDDNRSP